MKRKVNYLISIGALLLLGVVTSSAVTTLVSSDQTITAKAATETKSGTWGTAPWTFEDGVLTIGSGELTRGEQALPWFVSSPDARKIDPQNITSIKFTGKVVTPSNSSGLFSYLQKLSNIDNMSNLDTQKTTNMNYMFESDASLSSLDLSSFDTSHVTSMKLMFAGNVGLTSLDLSSFDTHNVTDMNEMFNAATGLTSLNLSSFDTHNVTDMSGMFSYDKALASLDVSHFDTRNVTDMSSIFSFNKALTSLDLSHFDTRNVTDMSGMFGNDTALTSLNLSSFDTSRVTNMYGMFSFDTALPALDLSNFDTSNVKSVSFIFYGDQALRRLTLGSKIRFNQISSLYSPSLPDVPDNANYTGKWQNVDSAKGGTVSAPKGNNVWTSTDLMKNYNGEADTYVWQPVAPVTTTLTINYYDSASRAAVGQAQAVTGVKLDTVYPTLDALKSAIKLTLPSGYELSATQTAKFPFTVTQNGQLTLDVTKTQPSQPTGPTHPVAETKVIPVKYVDDTGRVVKQDSITGHVGEMVHYTVIAPTGYTYDGSSPLAYTIKDQNNPLIIKVTRVHNGIQKKMAVIMNQGGYLYRTSSLSKAGRIHYKRGTRQQRPMFVVDQIVSSKQGILYHVHDVNRRFVNSNPKTDGKRGYIKATKNIINAYYSGKFQELKVINQHGINAYKHLNLTGKVKHFKLGRKIKVVRRQRHNLTYRYQLTNGTWITANKKLVTKINPIHNGIQKKMAVIMNQGGYLYPTTALNKAMRIYYKRGTRQQRPMFVVDQIISSKRGFLYRVRDVNRQFVNSNPKTNGRWGYIKANHNVINAYYSGKVRQFKVINKHGINSYKRLNLTDKTKHFKLDNKIKVTRRQRYNLTYRYQLTNGTWITANKKLVIKIK